MMTMTLPDDEFGIIQTKAVISLKSKVTATSPITGLCGGARQKTIRPTSTQNRHCMMGGDCITAIVSNMVADSRGNLRFIAGYGLPYLINNNLPLASGTGEVPNHTNFVWLQWGQDLSTKIASFLTTGSQAWDLIQELAQLMNWELGFGPGANKVEAVQVEDTSISDWSANASFFLRPRTILPAKLRTAISASGTLTTIRLNDSGLPAEASEFPDPPSGARYTVVINEELFTYTGVTPDSQGTQSHRHPTRPERINRGVLMPRTIPSISWTPLSRAKPMGS